MRPLARRGGAEDGHSLFSALFGVLMFLTLLLFSVQVTVHLHATTVVTTAAFDAARMVSGSRSIVTNVAAPELCLVPTPQEFNQADAHLKSLLGGLWEAPGRSSDWSASTAEQVTLTVSVTSPAKIVAGAGALVAGLGSITRTITLGRECVL